MSTYKDEPVVRLQAALDAVGPGATYVRVEVIDLRAALASQPVTPDPLRAALTGLIAWADEVNESAVENDYWPIGEPWDAARAALASQPVTRGQEADEALNVIADVWRRMNEVAFVSADRPHGNLRDVGHGDTETVYAGNFLATLYVAGYELAALRGQEADEGRAWCDRTPGCLLPPHEANKPPCITEGPNGERRAALRGQEADEERSLAVNALGEAIRQAGMLRTESVTIQAPLARYLLAALRGQVREGLDVERLALAIEGHSHVGAPSERVISCGRGNVEGCAAAIAAEYDRLLSGGEGE